jgi:hypothetical protein
MENSSPPPPSTQITIPTILVDHALNEIVAGYKRIIETTISINQTWRESLLTAYARRYSLYEDELKQYQIHSKQLKRRMIYGMILASALLFLGLLVFPLVLMIKSLGDLRGSLFCFAPILILGGLNGWAIIVVVWYLQRDKREPEAPIHPLKNNLYQPLLPRWYGQMRGSFPPKWSQEGVGGYYHYVARLQSSIPNIFILQGLELAKDETVDVILVGQFGIWVFETRYLKGTIRWRDGIWTQRKTSLRPSKLSITEIQDIEAFDQKWQKMTALVNKTIETKLPDLVTQFPKIARLRGGLVFTNSHGKYEIPPGCPFNWGLIPFWLDTLRKMPPVAGIDEGIMIKVVEVLLSSHQENTGLAPLRSMDVCAKKLIEEAEVEIKTWIDQTESLPVPITKGKR